MRYPRFVIRWARRITLRESKFLREFDSWLENMPMSEWLTAAMCGFKIEHKIVLTNERQEKLLANLSKNNALYDYMRTHGKIKTISAGPTIEEAAFGGAAGSGKSGLQAKKIEALWKEKVEI